MDRDAATTLAMVDPQPAQPADELLDREWPVAGRDAGTEMDERMAAGAPLTPYQVRRRPIATSTFTTGSSR